ncbi:uncharacterized protein N7479_005954 [Penicillium vulpinum]|nr:uncharacterized protein N7479_005954 [Penicillium vulpinum]KAJ5958804.1 hypothetical protein N7479_005954 [Penicillium vulpinum]
MTPLCEIIKLEPENEPWCAGYAPSQGRRCHARTNARGRRSAMILLSDGTKDLCTGRNIDTLLEDLAPHVLCTRFHQNQASDLARRWKRQVRTYLDSQVVSMPYRRPVRTPSRMISAPAEANMDDMIVVLRQKLRDAEEELRRFKLAQSGRPVTTMSPHHEGRAMSAVVNSSSMGRAPSRNPPVNRVNETVRRELTQSSTNQSAITTPPPVQAQASLQTSDVSISIPRPVDTPNMTRPVSTPTVAHVASSTGTTASRDEISQVNRRKIEGECGICLRNLHCPQDEDREEQEESENSGGDDNDDNDQHNDDDDDKDDDDEQLEELVWCKTRCGVNFHKQCIDQWLETDHASTCPTCRSDWKQ